MPISPFRPVISPCSPCGPGASKRDLRHRIRSPHKRSVTGCLVPRLDLIHQPAGRGSQNPMPWASFVLAAKSATHVAAVAREFCVTELLVPRVSFSTCQARRLAATRSAQSFPQHPTWQGKCRAAGLRRPEVQINSAP